MPTQYPHHCTNQCALKSIACLFSLFKFIYCGFATKTHDCILLKKEIRSWGFMDLMQGMENQLFYAS